MCLQRDMGPYSELILNAYKHISLSTMSLLFQSIKSSGCLHLYYSHLTHVFKKDFNMLN